MGEPGINDPAKEAAPAERKNGEEACKTFVEQTKQLIALASAFIFAPAAVQILLQLSIGKLLVIAEVLFIFSVLSGYVALGAIAGSQHKGEFNVHNSNAKWSGLAQFFTYLAGLLVFMFWFINQPPKATTVAQPIVNNIVISQPNSPNVNTNANPKASPCLRRHRPSRK
jgi:hypothetical protein